MKYLIDTQILIWYQTIDNRIKSSVYDILTNVQNSVYISQISLFEIAIKQKLGKIPDFDLPIRHLVELVEQDGFEILPIKNEHIDSYNIIPLFDHHRDPFDRLILATALQENFTLISADTKFTLYNDIITLIEN